MCVCVCVCVCVCAFLLFLPDSLVLTLILVDPSFSQRQFAGKSVRLLPLGSIGEFGSTAEGLCRRRLADIVGPAKDSTHG